MKDVSPSVADTVDDDDEPVLAGDFDQFEQSSLAAGSGVVGIPL